MEFQLDFWTEAANEVARAATEWAPRILGAALVLVLGWLIALVCQAVVRGVLRRIGLDRLSERAGVDDTLATMGMNRSVSTLIGRLTYWLVVLFFLMVALEGLGLTAVTETLASLIGYLPHVLTAVVVLLFGAFIARVAGDGVAALATQSGIEGGALLGRVTQWAVLTLTVVLALDQLRLDTTLIVVLMIVLVGAAALALALAFGLGTREMAGRLVAGFHVKEMYTRGQMLRIGKHSGRLIRVGPSTTLLDTDEGRVSIPNDVLLGTEVVVFDRADAADEPGPSAPGGDDGVS